MSAVPLERTPATRPAVCPRDGFAWVLDGDLVRDCHARGWPVVEVYRCRNGHTRALWPAQARRTWTRSQRPCAVCGLALTGGRSNKYHPVACASFAERENSRWHAAHPGEVYILEDQPWYRGPLYQVAPLPALDPLAGRIPLEWAAGWLRVHGLEPAEGAA